MHKTHILALVALLGCLAASAAPFDNCGFDKVPRDAVIELKEARGKPFTGGAVFVNGKYLEPPYVVSRYGTALAINGHQVTGQIIPWYKFTGGRPPAPPKPAVAKPVKQEEPAGAEEEASSLDDLFADEPEVPKAKAPAVPAKPEPEEPAAQEDAEESSAPAKKFEPSARSQQYLELINNQRTTLDRNLRQQNFYFFSPRYSSVRGNFRILSSMAEKLPDALKDSTSPEDLFARLRREGLGFISMEVCTDLFANKLTFPSLFELRSRVREEAARRKELSVGTSY